MPVVIGKAVGENADNAFNDTAQIDVLLQKVGLLGPFCPLDKVRNDAIRKFQEIYNLKSNGKYDGKIDPGGTTLKRLNEAASPLVLNPITPDRIDRGGYKVSFKPAAPPAPYQLRFGFSNTPGEFTDVTGCKNADVMNLARLGELLKIIKRRGSWGREVPVRLFVVLNNKLVSESAPVMLKCPVQPHNGKMLALDETNNGAKLTYQGDSATGPFYGRMFHEFDGIDGYFFKYGGVLETDVARRGFDCITYAGTTCGASIFHMTESAGLCNHLGATTCTIDKVVPPAKTPSKVELENTDPQNVKDFFAANTTGYYLMFSGGHIVIVANGTVHEFSYGKQGYATTDVQAWLEPYKTKKLTVRKLASKPALAS